MFFSGLNFLPFPEYEAAIRYEKAGAWAVEYERLLDRKVRVHSGEPKAGDTQQA